MDEEAVVERSLRYSERKRLQESGSLGPLVVDDVPAALRKAVELYFTQQRSLAHDVVGGRFDTRIASLLAAHFARADWTVMLSALALDDFLDLLEILLEAGLERHRYDAGRRGHPFAALAPNAQSDLNALFDRFRFGYRMDARQIRAIGSPALSHSVIGPALLASARPGWDEVQARYASALRHQRHSGETRDALTAASAAVEAALRAAGYKGATLGDLARDFQRSPVVRGYSSTILSSLVTLLAQLTAWRSRYGDVQGNESGSDRPPQELADLAIHWAGAFLVYFSETSRKG